MSSHNLSRREFLQMGVITGAGALLAACAPQPSPAPIPTTASAAAAATAVPQAPAPTVAPASAGGVVTVLQIDASGMTTHSKGVDETIKAFEALNPGIHIERVIAPSAPSETWTVINTALASGTPPDIFWGSGRAWMKDLARKGIIMDLTDEVKSWGYNFLPGTATQMTFKDKIYSAPYLIQFKFFTYNKDLFKKYDLPIPTTWQEWNSTCDELKKQKLTSSAFGCLGGDQWAALNWVWLFNQKLMGIKAVAADMEVETGTYENPLYEQALDMLTEQNDKGYFGVNPVSRPHQVAQAELFGGVAGSMYSGSWDLSTMIDPTKCPPEFLNQISLESKIWHDPAWPGEPHGVQGGAMGWDIPTKAPHKAEVLKWLKFYCGPEAAQIFHHHASYFMANTDYKAEWTNAEIVKLTESLKSADGMLDFGDQSGDPNIWPVYCRGIEAVLNHESTAKEAMDKVRAAATEARGKAAQG